MRTLMVVLDGVGQEDYTALPSVQAATGHWLASHTPAGRTADSLTCIMTLLGVPPDEIPQGRSYLEALAVGCPVGEADVVFRCNGVTLEKGRLVSSCTPRPLPDFGEGFLFLPLGGYKNLLVAKGMRHCFDALATAPPHDHIGEEIAKILPVAGNVRLEEILRRLVYDYQLWPWGQAAKVPVKSFRERQGVSGAVVCKTEIVRGIALSMGMECPELENATAETDTDLTEKVQTALRLAGEYAFTLLHINGADEAAHRQNNREKMAFLQRVNREVLLPLLEARKTTLKGSRLIVTSDHVTDSKTGRHTPQPVDSFLFEEL